MNLTANAILEEFWDCKIPVNVSHFAERLGFTLKYDEGLDYKDGELSIENMMITINPSLSDTQQRLTIARELGTYALGLGSTKIETHDLKWLIGTIKKQDQKVTEFVADLLIPPLALKAMVDIRGIKNPLDLRQSFMVSSNLLYYQLKRYGYAKE